MSFVRRRILEPVLALLQQGVTPRRLAVSLACGFVIGIVPVLGVSTVLCTLVALALRLNLVAIQVANFAASPFQLLLIIPFVRLGETLVGAPPQPITLEAGFQLIQQGVVTAVTALWDAIVHSVLAWLLVGPVVGYLLYIGLRPLLASAARRFFPDRQSLDSA